MAARPQAGKQVSKQQVRAMIKGVIGQALEQKRYVVASTGLTTSAAGTVSPITQGIIQGDTVSTRDGNQIVVHQVVFRHQLIASAASLVAQRVIVFSDTMADGATPAVADVLDSASFITGYNVANAQERRFHIIHDQFVTSSSTGQNFNAMHTWTFKLNKKVTYNAATNVAGANGRNSLFVLFIADSAIASYGLSYEVKFTDA